MKTVNIIGDKLLPKHVRVLGGILVLTGIFMLVSRSEYLIGFVLILIGMFMLTSRQGTIIDTDHRIVKPYYWILGLKFGKTHPYKELDRILIKKYRGKMEMGTTVQRTQTSITSFDAWLQTKEGEEYYLFDESNQQDMYVKLSKYTPDLEIKVFDQNA